jgi:hypothetical protein
VAALRDHGSSPAVLFCRDEWRLVILVLEFKEPRVWRGEEGGGRRRRSRRRGEARGGAEAGRCVHGCGVRGRGQAEEAGGGEGMLRVGARFRGLFCVAMVCVE